jgi:hypothetical protein
MLQNSERCLTPAQIGSLIPTSTGKDKDREEVRKKTLKPLLDLGFVDKVTARPGKHVILGHPVPKSPYCAYRVSQDLVRHVLTGSPFDFNDLAQETTSSLNIFDASSTHEQLMDSCIVHFAAHHLPGAHLIYRDPCHGPKMDLESAIKLAAAGLELDAGKDPIPDLVFWNEHTDEITIVEVITSEGVIDDARLRVLKRWVLSHRPGMQVKCVSAYITWKAACRFLGTTAKGSFIWVQETPFRMMSCV